MLGLIYACLILAGGLVVGCCWGIYNRAYALGYRNGRNYQESMYASYQEGAMAAQDKVFDYPSVSIAKPAECDSRPKEEWE